MEVDPAGVCVGMGRVGAYVRRALMGPVGVGGAEECME